MKNLLLFLHIICFSGFVFAQKYDNYFTNDRLRLDMYHYGTDSTDNYSLKKMIKETPWSGPVKDLNEAPVHGSYIVRVRLTGNKELIYQSAFNTLFEEWQDTENADRTRIFEESIFIPFPKTNVNIEIFAHADDLSLYKVWETGFDPDKTRVEINRKSYESELIYGNENYKEAVDIAIIAEGYKPEEMKDFRDDANRMVNFFLNTAPFNGFKDKFNFYVVLSPSKDSGADLPGENIWKETVADSRFYTFGSERYLTTLSYHKCMDLVSGIPHDQIILLVNSDKYGGGGIFNHFSVTSARPFSVRNGAHS